MPGWSGQKSSICLCGQQKLQINFTTPAFEQPIILGPKKSGKIEFMVHGALPKWPIIKFNPVWQSRQQALKAY